MLRSNIHPKKHACFCMLI